MLDFRHHEESEDALVIVAKAFWGTEWKKFLKVYPSSKEKTYIQMINNDIISLIYTLIRLNCPCLILLQLPDDVRAVPLLVIIRIYGSQAWGLPPREWSIGRGRLPAMRADLRMWRSFRRAQARRSMLVCDTAQHVIGLLPIPRIRI